MRERLTGMQDRRLELSASQVEDIVLEQTPIGQRQVPSLRDQWDTYTREELIAVRDKIKAVSQPKHHPKTPLPNPQQ